MSRMLSVNLLGRTTQGGVTISNQGGSQDAAGAGVSDAIHPESTDPRMILPPPDNQTPSDTEAPENEGE